MRLLVLGAGFMQLRAIKMAKEKGHTVIVADYLADAPGKKLADFAEMTSTFDIEGNIKLAKKYQVDGIFTIGTDQPVRTAAVVADALHLPSMISPETALQTTNKKYMKALMEKEQIPSSKYLLIHKEELNDSESLRKRVCGLNFPTVIKPLDSQGQRGVFKLYEWKQEAVAYMRQTFAFTGLNEIIMEEFVEGKEITVSAWVEDFQPYILLVTDRPLLNIEPHLGVPDGHVFPSASLQCHYHEIKKITADIVKALKIESGPIYVQMIVGADGIKVVEIAARIGGGHEEELIPLLTGIDVVDMFIEKSLGHDVNLDRLKNYCVLNNRKNAMVKFLIARAGKVAKMEDLHEVKKMSGIVNAAFYNPGLKVVKELVDSTCRVGYLLGEGENQASLINNINMALRYVRLYDSAGNNMICCESQETGKPKLLP